MYTFTSEEFSLGRDEELEKLIPPHVRSTISPPARKAPQLDI